MTLISAKYICDFAIQLTFVSEGLKFTTIKDFLPLFQQYVKGNNLKYFAPERFKKFIVKNGNIYWGRNEDVIFPVHLLFADIADKKEEEVLYVI